MDRKSCSHSRSPWLAIDLVQQLLLCTFTGVRGVPTPRGVLFPKWPFAQDSLSNLTALPQSCQTIQAHSPSWSRDFLGSAAAVLLRDNVLLITDVSNLLVC
jgi:hypothetical protein